MAFSGGTGMKRGGCCEAFIRYKKPVIARSTSTTTAMIFQDMVAPHQGLLDLLQMPSSKLLHPLPVQALSLLTERPPMKNLSDELGRLRDSHAGAVEEQISIGEDYIVFADGLKFRPPGMPLQQGLFA